MRLTSGRKRDTETTSIRGADPGGTVRPQGPPGNPPATYLSVCLSGANGSSQVTVMRTGGTSITNPSGYRFKVVSFDICDENYDGINVPSEHLLVTNIKAENKDRGDRYPHPWYSLARSHH